MQTNIGTTLLHLVTGDIADQDTDAVVTAAHWRLNKGNGTEGTIHLKGGPRIYEECQRIGGCPIGDAVISFVPAGTSPQHRLQQRSPQVFDPWLAHFNGMPGSGFPFVVRIWK